MSLSFVLLALLGASDPCAPVKPHWPADPAAAAPYLEVAEEERAAGELDTAIAAYQEALRVDPTSESARAGLEALCAARRPPADQAIERALALLDAGQPKAALEALAAEPDTVGKPEAALLEGMAHLVLGEDEAAATALRAARDAPDTAPAARLYLGILSLRRGEARQAASLLEAASLAPDTRISRRAASLLPHARREGRLSLAVRVGADYDSNVDLAPADVSLPEGSADKALGLVAALAFQPLGAQGPFLRMVAHARKHQRFYGLDLWGAGAEAGWAHEGTAFTLSTALSLDYAALGGAPYLWAPRLEATARTRVGALVLETQGQFRWESFEVADFADYSGPYASGQQGLVWQSDSGGLELAVAYALGYHGARVLPLAALEHGPRAELWVRPFEPLRVGLTAAGGWRRHADFDPTLSVRREDGFAEGVLSLDWALGSYWSVQAQVSGQRVRSNVSRFSHDRWVGGVAVVGNFGLL